MNIEQELDPEKLSGNSSDELRSQIEQLRSALAELKESATRYEELYNVAPSGFFTINVNNLITEVNLTMSNMLGLPRNQLIRTRIANYIFHEDHSVFYESRKLMAEMGIFQSCHLRLLKQDYSFFWVRMEGKAVIDTRGNVVTMFSVSNITGQKMAEEALQKSEEQFRLLFEEMISGFALHEVILDGNGLVVDYRFLTVNRSFENLTGLKMNDIVGRTVLEVLPATDRELIERYGRVALTGIPDQFETFSAPLGKYFEVRAYSPGQGKFAVMFHDITESKLASKQLDIHNIDLEQRIHERTAKLEALNEELEAFSYSVSHDLRAPLRAIDGFIRIIMEDFGSQFGEECLRLFNVVRSNARKMDNLIINLLEMSRISRSEMTIIRQDMTLLVKMCYNEITTSDERAEIEFIVDPLLVSECDGPLIWQAWSNLILNAVKFTKNRAGRRIEIGSFRGNSMNVYFIKDNGVGFNPDYSHKLFSTFQRLHSESDFEGTGIGLAIVKRIIHRHEGKVWAESVPGSGATFFFSLP